jgi:hypothetical protein
VRTATTYPEHGPAVGNAGSGLVLLLLSFGTLATLAYRVASAEPSAWDVMAVLNASGALATANQGAQSLLQRRWPVAVLSTLVVADVIALVAR